MVLRGQRILQLAFEDIGARSKPARGLVGRDMQARVHLVSFLRHGPYRVCGSRVDSECRGLVPLPREHGAHQRSDLVGTVIPLCVGGAVAVILDRISDGMVSDAPGDQLRELRCLDVIEHRLLDCYPVSCHGMVLLRGHATLGADTVLAVLLLRPGASNLVQPELHAAEDPERVAAGMGDEAGARDPVAGAIRAHHQLLGVGRVRLLLLSARPAPADQEALGPAPPEGRAAPAHGHHGGGLGLPEGPYREALRSRALQMDREGVPHDVRASGARPLRRPALDQAERSDVDVRDQLAGGLDIGPRLSGAALAHLPGGTCEVSLEGHVPRMGCPPARRWAGGGGEHGTACSVTNLSNLH
mmetsp:Transcript_67021/g.174461  ORF Transcript_67021/g.174461 Transcript_67021/m.174461 type:complete len:357 (-) Transcript_67021:17-1087(-)